MLKSIKPRVPPAPAVDAAPVAGAVPDRVRALAGLPATKFRAPRQRRGQVQRPRLLDRLRALAIDRRVTLVCASAGFGKSTLLQQLAAALAPQLPVCWLTVDADDNDINRLFLSLLVAFDGLALEWAVEPRILASQVRVAGAQARTAVADLVNALSSFGGERLLLVLDDVQHLTDPDALQLLGELIDRLPPEAGVVLGSRSQPALPLARWRARDELGELGADELSFDAGEAYALAQARADGSTVPLPAEYLEQALQRTRGWAAGLQLVLGAADRRAVASLPQAVDRVASRYLFDFFADEVLARLPPDRREFLLRCAVLPELRPELCAAVSERDDTSALLEDLYRRNLFLTALDERGPVLRLHDLFAEFLQTQLALRHPGLAPLLHARAARAETLPQRALLHWLHAGEWSEALSLMCRCAEPVLALGGLATVQRWLDQLPAAVLADAPEVAHLQALCAQSRWDFDGAARLMQRAVAGFERAGRGEAGHRSAALLPRMCNGAGLLAAADDALATAERLSLSPSDRVACNGGGVWQALAMGRIDRAAAALAFIAEQTERDPRLLQPAIDDLFNSFLFGLPGTMAPLRRLRALCRRLLQAPSGLRPWAEATAEALPGEGPPAAWQVEALAAASWPEFWTGERASAEAAVARQTDLRQRLGVVAALGPNDAQARAWLAAARGDFDTALQVQQQALQALDDIGVPSLSAAWRRATALNLAHFHWMAGDRAGLGRWAAALAAPRTPPEWPFIETGQLALRGRLALLDGRPDEAETLLRQAEQRQRQAPMPTFFGDVRCSLALAQLRRGDRPGAWATLAPVVRQALDDGALGPLLMESAAVTTALWSLLPPDAAATLDATALAARLADWRHAVADDGVPPAASALAQLSEREREVLAGIARGDSNKLIARALDLSPHTVKRHVANILDKLGCGTRLQAARFWRDTREPSRPG